MTGTTTGDIHEQFEDCISRLRSVFQLAISVGDDGQRFAVDHLRERIRALEAREANNGSLTFGGDP